MCPLIRGKVKARLKFGRVNLKFHQEVPNVDGIEAYMCLSKTREIEDRTLYIFDFSIGTHIKGNILGSIV